VRATAALFAILTLAAPGLAQAGRTVGGSYDIDGGTRSQRTQITRALEVSLFDWGHIPVRVQIHVAPGIGARSAPGHIWLSPELLGAGIFSWAFVQDEYAHQVDFFLLDPVERAYLNQLLGTEVWCYADRPGLAHSAYGCERFTASFVWSFWPAKENAYKPRSRRDAYASALDPSAFRNMVSTLISS
jgi:hypothetical protein